MKHHFANLTFKSLIIALAVGGWSLPTAILADDQKPTTSLERRQEYDSKLVGELKEYKEKSATIYANLPTIANKASITSFFNEPDGLGFKAAADFKDNNLDGAEEKLKASLSLEENPVARMKLAIVLLEEGKWVEALPSCVDIALEDHTNHPMVLKNMLWSIEYQTLPHLLLAYALVKTGHFKQAEIAFQFAKKKVDKEYIRDFQSEPSMKVSDYNANLGGFRLPFYPKQAYEEKTDEKKLTEDIAILFTTYSAVIYKGDPNVGNPTIHAYRLTKKMMEEAQVANPTSALMAFYKGLNYGRYEWNTISEEDGVKISKDKQSWFIKAIDLARDSTPLGKLASVHLKEAQKNQARLEKIIEDRKNDTRSPSANCVGSPASRSAYHRCAFVILARRTSFCRTSLDN